MTLVFLIAGLILLVVGAEGLVRGASRLAAAAGISPLVIGLTVVAYGTSMPETVVSVVSSLKGQPDLALGNVVGSNIFNVLFILGVAALIVPLVVSRQLVRLDVPIMIGASFLLVALGFDGGLSRVDGTLLFGGAVAYTWFLIRQSRKESRDQRVAKGEDEFATEFGTKPGRGRFAWLVDVGFLAGGLGALVLGSRWLVDAAVTFAKAFGVSELVIGLTIVAAGTSLPEVATSIVASIRGERDIAVGNVVGSNIFNILCVLGLASLVSPTGVAISPAALSFDIPVMIAVALACLPIFFTDHLIARWEGGLFLAYYVAYTAYLVLAATKHDALAGYSNVMVVAVLPLTAVTLFVLGVRAFRAGRHRLPEAR